MANTNNKQIGMTEKQLRDRLWHLEEEYRREMANPTEERAKQRAYLRGKMDMIWELLPDEEDSFSVPA